MKFEVKYEHWLFKLPIMKSFEGVTLGRTIYFRLSNRQVKQKLLNHELVHVEQVNRHGIIKFYFIYLKDFIIQLFKYRHFRKAYLSIPFEVEAYQREENYHEKI